MNKYTRIIVGIFSFLYIFSITISPVMASRAYTYDANGNMTSDGARCYEYNEANQVKHVKHCNNNQPIADYIYDYNGNRIVKKQYNSGTLEKTVISPNDEYDITKLASSSATYTSSYYYANDQLIAKKDPYNNFTYYHNDHLGSASIVTNEGGDVVEETTYDPWGEVKSGGTKNKYQYTGQEKDDETGLNYYNARYYDPHTKRFIQPDEIIQNIYDPQTLNRYAYVRNNPLKNTDPTGHIFDTILDIGFVAWDIYTIVQDPGNMENWASLAGDTAGLLIPGLTGGGMMVKAAMHADDAVKLANKAQNVVEVAKSVNKADNITKISNLRTGLKKLTGLNLKNAQAHHVFPQKFRETFDKIGLKIDEAKYGVWWESSSHSKNAYWYNKQWAEFLEREAKNNTLSKDRTLEYGKKIMDSYGYKTNYK